MTDTASPENPAGLKRGDLVIIAKVRRTSGGGYPSCLIPKAKLKRLLAAGAIRYKPSGGVVDFSTPDHVWASRAAQAGYVIHGPNADAMLREHQP